MQSPIPNRCAIPSRCAIDEIKNRLDIVDVVGSYIKLQKAGVNYRAVCPFHSEKTPSFFVSPARQIWHCFGSCSEGGDIFKFVMKVEGVEFGDALRILANKAGVELKKQDPKIKTKRQRMYEICNLASAFFEKQLEKSSAGKKAENYLFERGIKKETLKKWRVGYSPESWQALSDFLVGRGYSREEIEQAGMAIKSEKGRFYDRFRARIMFPVFDFNSQVIGFGARVFEKNPKEKKQEAKYINTPATLIYDKSSVLYGLNNSGIEMRKKDSCILVEGYMDVLMASQAGFENIAASSGTALTPRQLGIIKRYTNNLFTGFDMDTAGDSATQKSIGLAQSMGFNIKVIIMDQGFDPADIIQQSPEKWEKAVKNAKTIHDFYFEKALAEFDKNTIEGKKSISKQLLPIIKKIPNKIEQSLWVKDLAGVLDVKEEDVLSDLDKVKIDQFQRIEEGADQVKQEENQEPPKTRKELLEERLLCLIAKNPENRAFICEEESFCFSSAFLKIMQVLAGDKDQEAEQEMIREIEAEINSILMRAEIEGNEENPEKEIKSCLKEIKKLFFRGKLELISKEIKKKEGEKNFDEVQKLINDFNHFSKLLCEL